MNSSLGRASLGTASLGQIIELAAEVPVESAGIVIETSAPSMPSTAVPTAGVVLETSAPAMGAPAVPSAGILLETSAPISRVVPSAGILLGTSSPVLISADDTPAISGASSLNMSPRIGYCYVPCDSRTLVDTLESFLPAVGWKLIGYSWPSMEIVVVMDLPVGTASGGPGGGGGGAQASGTSYGAWQLMIDGVPFGWYDNGLYTTGVTVGPTGRTGPSAPLGQTSLESLELFAQAITDNSDWIATVQNPAQGPMGPTIGLLLTHKPTGSPTAGNHVTILTNTLSGPYGGGTLLGGSVDRPQGGGYYLQSGAADDTVQYVLWAREIWGGPHIVAPYGTASGGSGSGGGGGSAGGGGDVSYDGPGYSPALGLMASMPAIPGGSPDGPTDDLGQNGLVNVDSVAPYLLIGCDFGFFVFREDRGDVRDDGAIEECSYGAMALRGGRVLGVWHFRSGMMWGGSANFSTDFQRLQTYDRGERRAGVVAPRHDVSDGSSPMYPYPPQTYMDVGAVNAIAVTDSEVTDYFDGLKLVVIPVYANTGAATAAVNALSPYPILSGGLPLRAGFYAAKAPIELKFSVASLAWLVIPPDDPLVAPLYCGPWIMAPGAGDILPSVLSGLGWSLAARSTNTWFGNTTFALGMEWRALCLQSGSGDTPEGSLWVADSLLEQGVVQDLGVDVAAITASIALTNPPYTEVLAPGSF